LETSVANPADQKPIPATGCRFFIPQAPFDSYLGPLKSGLNDGTGEHPQLCIERTSLRKKHFGLDPVVGVHRGTLNSAKCIGRSWIILDLEVKKGITIKSQAIQMEYKLDGKNYIPET